ncbi:MAG: SCP2 sterol-binding domain-containing protein [Saccharospirillum sp.]|nr:SCP2 sterol-binding domain-containing protein [Saccharospirillum sp.]
MKLRLLLWLMAMRFRRAIKRNPAMQAHLKDTHRTVQFTAGDRVARYLAFEDQSFTSRAKRAEKADVTLDFVTPAIGFNVLWQMATGADRNAIMRAIQDKKLQVSGDPMLLMWFQKSVKYLR